MTDTWNGTAASKPSVQYFPRFLPIAVYPEALQFPHMDREDLR